MLDEVRNIMKEWLFHVLYPLPKIERCMMLMTLWGWWYICNEVVHHKPPHLMEALKRFLVSYLDSLLGLKLDLGVDLCKNKMIYAI